MRSNCSCVKILLFIFFAVFIFSGQSKAQSYGLAFASHDSVADQRTSLDLFPGEGLSITGNFRLSFDFSFVPGQKDYFGYIFRIIQDNKKNIDLIYNKRNFMPLQLNEDPNHFKLILEEQYTKINFNIPPSTLLKRWNHFELEFDVDNNRLICYVNHQKYVENKVKSNKTNNYKILFGTNNYLHFKTKDSPPIKIRNVNIINNNKTQFSWPLNEAGGNVAYEQISGKNGEVNNPLWIRAAHRNWSHVNTLQVKGLASVAFNPKDTVLYIIGRDSLYQYSLNGAKTSVTGYRSGPLNLLPSNQSVYNPYNHTLYNYYIDRNNKTLTSFNFNTRKWDNNYNYIPYIDYWHSNNFFSKVDSSLYVIGGYGQLTYKNKVQRYDLANKQWETVKAKGDTYNPRYLAASAASSDGKTVYLLGGYGSVSGTQVLNPKNMYDLVKYDVSTKTFKKIYQLKTLEKDFVFANTMVIDEKAQTFTALIFSNHMYNSSLRLMQGSLLKPEYKIIGSEIPYPFHDTHAFASLFHAPGSQKLVAVTLTRTENDNSIAKIYVLSYPPDSSKLEDYTKSEGSAIIYLYVLILLLLIVVVFSVYILRRKLPFAKNKDTQSETEIQASSKINQTAILLFGDLKLYDSKGSDITGQYTSLVKELFLVILIYSLKSGSGISPEKLIELLWGHKPSESAKNNRSANLSKLRSLLSQMEYLQLSKETGNWKIDFDFDHVYVDYSNFLKIVSEKSHDKEKIMALTEITQRGSFLQSADYPWLDHIKSEISNEVIDIYINYATQIKIEDDPEFLIKLSNSIFNFDPVNEEIMAIKCKALAYLGKHSLASSTFVAFRKEYMSIYGEEFKRDFHSILEKE